MVSGWATQFLLKFAHSSDEEWIILLLVGFFFPRRGLFVNANIMVLHTYRLPLQYVSLGLDHARWVYCWLEREYWHFGFCRKLLATLWLSYLHQSKENYFIINNSILNVSTIMYSYPFIYRNMRYIYIEVWTDHIYLFSIWLTIPKLCITQQANADVKQLWWSNTPPLSKIRKWILSAEGNALFHTEWIVDITICENDTFHNKIYLRVNVCVKYSTGPSIQQFKTWISVANYLFNVNTTEISRLQM